MENKGWIKLHRSFLEWEWYQDHNVVSVFLHCLLKANHIKKKWQGIEIDRGEFISSYQNISNELSGKNGKLSVMQVRVSLKKLILTGEITIKTTNRYSLIKVNNYNQYQDINMQDNKQITIKQQTDNKQITTTKERKELKNEKNDKNKEIFEIFRKSYKGKKRGLETEFENFTKKHKDWKEIIPTLLDSLKKQIDHRNQLRSQNKFVPEWKNLQTWINQRCWEEEFEQEGSNFDSDQADNIARARERAKKQIELSK